MSDNNSADNTDTELKPTFFRRVLGWGRQLALLILFSMVFSAGLDMWRGKDIPRDDLPNISGISLKGESLDIAALSRDQAVLVYFWGTWCPVCNLVSPAVDVLSTSYSVVTVAMNSGADDKMVKYLKHKEYDFEVINDSSNDIARDWSVQLTPTIMVFKDGELKHYTTGFTSLPGMWWRMLFT
ncbi:redoxin domain protein [Shewanella sediminis HAW-EB3]|uniref:Redoxin domain protein n=1 Tax=Shewanella sediminis (strain HAW-EB3) TaxID=425104 RepID=A8FZ79_SHESH|nr:protein disulfide oxidoreductase [Shewanella sediminis]ABV38152.1 redoxin domain protein [Shewanella sediminis HAW-EB3]